MVWILLCFWVKSAVKWRRPRRVSLHNRCSHVARATSPVLIPPLPASLASALLPPAPLQLRAKVPRPLHALTNATPRKLNPLRHLRQLVLKAVTLLNPAHRLKPERLLRLVKTLPLTARQRKNPSHRQKAASRRVPRCSPRKWPNPACQG